MTGYHVTDYQLFAPGGRLLLGGPADELAAFAAALNQTRPAGEKALRGLLVALIDGTRDCSFAPFIPLSDEAAADLEEARADLRQAEARRRAALASTAQGHLF